MKQLALNLGLAASPSLSSFHAAGNSEVLKHLEQCVMARGRISVPTYLWGDTGSGKTHLLAGVRDALQEMGLRIGWLDASTPGDPDFDDDWDVVLMDDAHLYGDDLQHAAFNWFVNAMTPKNGHLRWVLAAGDAPPADLRHLREDLRTRLGSGHVYHLQPLDEAACRTVLNRQAQARGLVLRKEVVDFMLSHFSRDLSSLVQLLNHLDNYALQTQRGITIPLIKSMLENE